MQDYTPASKLPPPPKMQDYTPANNSSKLREFFEKISDFRFYSSFSQKKTHGNGLKISSLPAKMEYDITLTQSGLKKSITS